MITTRFNGMVMTAHPEFGHVVLAERRGDMAVIRTERVVYIENVREQHPQAGAVEMPCDCEGT